MRDHFNQEFTPVVLPDLKLCGSVCSYVGQLYASMNHAFFHACASKTWPMWCDWPTGDEQGVREQPHTYSKVEGRVWVCLCRVAVYFSSKTFKMSPPEKKRKTISLARKVDILHEVESGEKKGDIAKKFEIQPSTLSSILTQKEIVLMKWSGSGSVSQRKKIRSVIYENVDQTLLKWFTLQRSRDVPISGPLMQEKARQFAVEFGHADFKASSGFLDSFKARHGITFRAVCGESATANVEGATQWIANVLPQLLHSYSEEDIYNADESALFYECLPNRTMAFKSDNCSGGKKSKVRITLLFCCNMSGSDKRRLLMIGRSAKPRCFKHVNICRLPVEYVANKRAWMTADIWNRWLTAFDRSMMTTERKVLLVVDNASTHHVPVSTLHAVKLVFLPPNATSLIQPWDQGIIQSFKIQYRSVLLRRLLLHLEGKVDVKAFSITLLDAVSLSNSAWSKVNQETIQHCFHHAGFHKERIIENPSHAQDHLDEEYRSIFTYISKHFAIQIKFTDVSPEIYAALDEEVATDAMITDEEIVRHIREEHTIDVDDAASVEEEGWQPPKQVSLQEVLQSLATLRNFFTEKEMVDNNLNLIEQQLASSILKPLRQTMITDYVQL